MAITRRNFIKSTATASALAGLTQIKIQNTNTNASLIKIKKDRFDPWIEVDLDALKHNVNEVQRITNGRPIVAVIKNNAYGLGLILAAQLLEPIQAVKAFAVVKTEAAFALREAGIKKPIHLMGRFPESVAVDLAKHEIQPCILGKDSLELIDLMSRSLLKKVPVQLYLDTGMSRMGIPYHHAVKLIKTLAESGKASIQGAFMGFTEESDFDREQLRRYLSVTKAITESGIDLGKRHIASSSAVFEMPEAHMDMVRPGMALYGGYPNDPNLQQKKGSLKCSFRLKARVVRIEQLRKGDSVSYGRKYIATKPTWVATIPVGHTDGYPRRAVDGARILIGNRTYPVIGAVSASHSIVELGTEKTVEIGDIATLFGPDVPEINPNWMSMQTGTSVYDIFMHLNPSIPRILV